MLLVESVLADRLVTKREQIYCAGLSAFLWKICWCCASMFSLILLCFCLRFPPLAFCLRFAVFINHSFHCSARSSTVYWRRILQFNLGEWFTYLTGMLSCFELLKLMWTSLAWRIPCYHALCGSGDAGTLLCNLNRDKETKENILVFEFWSNCVV